MSEPNNIWHFYFPITHNARGYNSTTFLNSTSKRHFYDTPALSVLFCTLLTHATVNSVATVILTDQSDSPSSYQFVGHGEAAATAPASSHAVVAAAIPEAGVCGFDWEDIS